MAAETGLVSLVSGATDILPTIIFGHVPPLCFFSMAASMVMQSAGETGSKGKEEGAFV